MTAAVLAADTEIHKKILSLETTKLRILDEEMGNIKEKIWFIHKRCYPLGKITSRGRPEEVSKRCPRTSPYRPLCNAKGRPLPTSLGRPLLTFFGSWNMTSWGRHHNVLYVTSRGVPCRRLEDFSCRRYEDVHIWSNL